MKRISNPRKHRGISLIWVILTFIVVFAILGLMLDWAYVFVVGSQMHNAADSAALAGARYVGVLDNPSADGYRYAPDVAVEYAGYNQAAKLSVNLTPGSDAITETEIDMSLPFSSLLPLFNDGDIYIGRYIDHNRKFIKNDDSPDAMLVVTRKLEGRANEPLPLLFAPIVTTAFGGDPIYTTGIQKYAVAKVDNPYGAGVLALGECCCPGITFGGSGSVDDLTIFNGGSLYVNSIYGGPDCPDSSSGAIDQTGNSDPDLALDRIYAVGGIDSKFDNPENADVHDYTDGVEPEPDPYAYLPDASYSTVPDLGTITGSGTYLPGYYSGGIQVTDSTAVIDLQPGDYYLDSIGHSASLAMNGGLVTGEGITFHIIGDADMGIDIGGNANIDITSPTSGPYADIAVFQKRNPDYDCSVACSDYPLSEFLGTGVIAMDGAVYMPHNKLTLGGTGDIFVTRVVADRLHIYGDGQKIVNYRGIPEIAQKSYLVE